MKRFRLDCIPAVLCILGQLITATDWKRIEAKIIQQVQFDGGQLVALNMDSQTSNGTNSTNVINTESQESYSSQIVVAAGEDQNLDPNVRETGAVALVTQNLSTKQIISRCNYQFEEKQFSSLTPAEQLYHIKIREAAIERLRQELSEVG